MTNSMEGKRIPAGKRNKNLSCRSIIGYGQNILEGKFDFKDVVSGKKTAPLSTELTTGVTIAAANGGNPQKRESSR